MLKSRAETIPRPALRLATGALSEECAMEGQCRTGWVRSFWCCDGRRAKRDRPLSQVSFMHERSPDTRKSLNMNRGTKIAYTSNQPPRQTMKGRLFNGNYILYHFSKRAFSLATRRPNLSAEDTQLAIVHTVSIPLPPFCRANRELHSSPLRPRHRRRSSS